jgi:hypothetical protein
LPLNPPHATRTNDRPDKIEKTAERVHWSAPRPKENRAWRAGHDSRAHRAASTRSMPFSNSLNPTRSVNHAGACRTFPSPLGSPLRGFLARTTLAPSVLSRLTLHAPSLAILHPRFQISDFRFQHLFRACPQNADF